MQESLILKGQELHRDFFPVLLDNINVLLK